MEYNTIFKDMLNVMDFELEKYDDGYGLVDLQGANFGDIESDRFTTAVEIIERMTIYLDDYYYNDLDDEYRYYFDDESNCPYSSEDWLKFMDDHLDFKEKHIHEYKALDIIANHLKEINLDEIINKEA